MKRFELERTRRTWVEIYWQAWLRMRQRGGPLLSGGLASGLFLFLLPAALFVVAIVGTFAVGRLARPPKNPLCSPTRKDRRVWEG